MTRRDIEIQFIRDKTTYGPMPHGQFAGEPTVSIKLSSSESNSMKVNSLENIFSTRKWLQKVNSGYARLRIFGDSPLHERHEEALEFLFDVFDPRFIDIELEDKYIDKEPSTFIKRRTDTYTFFIDATRDEPAYDPEMLKHISDNYASAGNAQFIFKVDSVTCEADIRHFRREYGIYDSDIWLYPKGRKAKTVADSYESIESVAKRNTWNVSPRLGVKPEEENESGTD